MKSEFHKLLGDYSLLKEIGEGSFGKVYLAQHNSSSGFFAIKKIKKESITGNKVMLNLFQEEVNITSTITHPNVIHLYELMATSKNFYLIFDYCECGKKFCGILILLRCKILKILNLF